MRKTEIIAFGLLGVFYLQKVLGLADIPGFGLLNIAVFLTISIKGFKLYRPATYNNKTKATLFAIFCGLAFASGIISFGSKIWQHSNIVALSFAIPNFILFPILIWQFLKNKKSDLKENLKFHKGLLIRSSIILVLSITVISLPYYTLNKYINRDQPDLYNKALSHDYYYMSIDLSKKGEFDNALKYANKSLESARIAWKDDTTYYTWPYEAMYEAYFGLIKQEFQSGDYDKVLQYSKLIEKPIQIWYGDTSKQEAYIKTILGEVYQYKGDYAISDSLLIEALNMYKVYFGTKNMFYTATLQLLANSYRERYYYRDAIELYHSVIYLLKEDSTNYTSSKNPDEAEFVIDNAIASAYSEMAWAYSLKQEYDTADIYFEKSFATKSFTNHRDYSSARTRFAYHTLNKGDYHKAKKAMEDAVQVAFDTYGEIHYDYLYALEGLNSVNTTLAKYKEAEQGCNRAISILQKITSQQDDYYASLLYSLAQIKYYQASYDSAAALFNQALTYTRENSLQYADILESLSRLNGDLTKFSIAILQAEQASKIADDYFEDDDSPYLTEYFRNEAYINYLRGQYDKADNLYQRCFSIDTTHKNQEKIGFASILNGIGLIKTARHKFTEADTLFDNSLKIYKKRIGEKHPNYATVLFNKAYLRLEQENLDEAEGLFNQALDIIKKVIDDKHDKVADNYTGLGEINLKWQNFQAALDYFKKANIIYKDKFDAEHKKVTLTTDYIDYCKKRIK